MTVDELLGQGKKKSVDALLAEQAAKPPSSAGPIPEPGGVETGPLPEQAGPMPGPAPWSLAEQSPISEVLAVGKALTPTTFAQGGALVGGLVGGPLGIGTAALGAMGGHVLDVMAANHWQLGSELIQGLTTRDSTKVMHALDALDQTMPEFLMSGAKGAGGQLAGLGIGKVLTPVAKAGGSLLEQATEWAGRKMPGISGLGPYMRTPPPPPPAAAPLGAGLMDTLTGGERLALQNAPAAPAVLGLEKRAAGTAYGLARQQALVAQTDQAAHEAMTEFVQQVSPTGTLAPKGAGMELNVGLKSARKTAAQPLSDLYNAVWLAAPEPRPLNNFLAESAALAGETQGAGAFGSRVLGKAGTVGDPTIQGLAFPPSTLQTMANLPPGMLSPKIVALMGLVPGREAPIQTMQMVRSGLAKLVSGSEEGIGSLKPEGVHALRLLGAIDKDMGEVLDTLPQPVKLGYEEAQRRWGPEVRELFAKPKVMSQIRELADQGKYASMLSLVFPRGVENGPLESVKKALPTNQFKRLVGSWWQTVIDKSFVNGKFTLDGLLTQVEPRNVDPSRFVTAFDKQHAADLQSVFGTMRDIKRVRELGALVPQSSLYHRMAFLLGAISTGTGIGGPLGGAVAAAGGVASDFLYPRALARVLFSKTGARTLADALGPKATQDKVINAAIRLAAIAKLPMPSEQPEAPEPKEPNLKDPQGFNPGAWPSK